MSANKIKLAHPGKILWEEFMEPAGITAYALAKSLHVSSLSVNDIVRERCAISPEMSVLLSSYFGTSDRYWLDLQGHYDLEIAKVRLAKQVARIKPHPHGANGALRASVLRNLRAKLVRRVQAQGVHTDDDVFRKVEES